MVTEAATAAAAKKAKKRKASEHVAAEKVWTWNGRSVIYVIVREWA
jgi:hypothetical protein